MSRLDRLLASENHRVALLALSGCVLFLAVATAGTWDDPYAPNDWSFSHAHLANVALESGRIPVNPEMFREHDFGQTRAAFQDEAGLGMMTTYANTAWHFWNGLPLHPALVATLASTSGLSPESVIRLPLAGVVVVLLVHATALVFAARTRLAPEALGLTPFLAALACAPLALDLRVAMPSVTLVALLLLLHALARRAFLNDKTGIYLALLPLVLLPFWYYTMAYFVILLFAGFLACALAARWWCRQVSKLAVMPLHAAVLVPVFLTVALLSTGTLESHVNMAQLLSDGTRDGSGASDYTTYLNREPWRSALLYAQLVALFLPLAAISALVLRDVLASRRVAVVPALLAQWAAGGALFALILVPTVGVSFLNRNAIYLAPAAVLAAVYLAGRHWSRRHTRVLVGAGMAMALVTTPLLVATSMPTYQERDRQAYLWMEETVPDDAMVYSGLEVSSVLLREHGFRAVNAFQPSIPVLDDFWYGDDPDRLVPYLSTFDYFVLREEFRTQGFEEYGPARKPISDDAYGKFSRSRDMHLVFDNGGVQVFRVDLHPDRHLAR